ncbi:MAG TPA: recombinase family protein, partial [Sphingomonas sp.]
MTLPAYIYARFSSVEQSKGSSLARQLKLGRAFIEKQKWLHSTERELIDEGRSAYHGANRAVGSALYEFEEKALAGHFANGACLVVE